MKPRREIAAAIGAVGAVAGANSALRLLASRLHPPLGRETGTYHWRGINIEYSEGGDPQDPDLVLLHSIHPAASSREFVRIFDNLTNDFHVIAPDFPGFGRSARPPLVYSARLYESFVRDLLVDLTDEPTVIASSLAGAYVSNIAPDLTIERLILISPTHAGGSFHHRFAGTFLRLPLVGTAAFNLRTSRFILNRYFERALVLDSESIGTEDRKYFWTTAHQPGARYAPAALVSGYLDAAGDAPAQLGNLSIPTTFVCGRESNVPSLRSVRTFAERSDSKLIVIDRSRSWPHYEQAESFLGVIEGELAKRQEGGP